MDNMEVEGFKQKRGGGVGGRRRRRRRSKRGDSPPFSMVPPPFIHPPTNNNTKGESTPLINYKFLFYKGCYLGGGEGLLLLLLL